MGLPVADTLTRGDTAGNTAIANAAGWGPASDGNTWAGSASLTWKITSNEGTATGSNSTLVATLDTVAASDMEALVRTSITNAGDNTGFGLCYTDSNNFYRVKLTSSNIVFDHVSGGVVTNLINAAFARTNNNFYWIRARILKGTAYVKVWRDGTTEPASWTGTAMDASPLPAGGVGLLIQLASAAHTASFDRFSVVTPAVTVLASAIGKRGHRGYRGSHGRSY